MAYTTWDSVERKYSSKGFFPAYVFFAGTMDTAAVTAFLSAYAIPIVGVGAAAGVITWMAWSQREHGYTRHGDPSAGEPFTVKVKPCHSVPMYQAVWNMVTSPSFGGACEP